jgi:hypothetical protein
MVIDWEECMRGLPETWKKTAMQVSIPESRIALIVDMYIRLLEMEKGEGYTQRQARHAGRAIQPL